MKPSAHAKPRPGQVEIRRNIFGGNVWPHSAHIHNGGAPSGATSAGFHELGLQVGSGHFQRIPTNWSRFPAG